MDLFKQCISLLQCAELNQCRNSVSIVSIIVLLESIVSETIKYLVQKYFESLSKVIETENSFFHGPNCLIIKSIDSIKTNTE